MVVLVAVDREQDSTEIVKEGKRLADAFDESLQVAHVLSRAELRDLERASFDETGEAVEMDRVKELAADIAREQSEAVAPEAETVGLVGEPAEEIVTHASDEDAMYIVLGGRQTSSVGKVIFGSVTQSVLLSADRPVVTILQE